MSGSEGEMDSPIMDDERRDTTTNPQRTTSKRKVTGFIMGSVIFAALVVMVILLGLHNEESGGSHPNPPNPPLWGINNYKVTQKNENETERSISLVMMANSTYPKQEKDTIRRHLSENLEDNQPPRSINATEEDPEQLYLLAQIRPYMDHILHLHIGSYGGARYEVPTFSQQELIDGWVGAFQHKDLEGVGFSYQVDPFTYKLTHDDGTTIFSTEGRVFNFLDDFIEFEAELASDQIYGLGERVHPFQMTEGTYTIFTRSQPTPTDDGKWPGKNLYGAHPFYMNHVRDDKFIGVYFKNTNAMDITIKKEGGKTIVNTRAVGGIIDLYIIHTAPAEYILRQYHALIGRPYLPPYWAMGYHQCRWGYKDLAMLKSVVEKFAEDKIPLDAIWNDLDYMDDKSDFTISPKYAGLGDYTQELLTKNIHYVPLLDAGIHKDVNNDIYVEGERLDAYIISNETKYELIAKVWPGPCVFIDFFNIRGVKLWRNGLEKLMFMTGLSGFWLDMNEIESMCDGECPGEFTNLRGVEDTEKKNKYSDLIYTPGGTPLNKQTISMNALHRGYDTNHNMVEYNVHNLWPLMESMYTHEYFVDYTRQRPFVLTRSSSPGSGHWASHWLGDNRSTYQAMKDSISGILNFQLFGIPHVGADICGFAGDATDEMCARWFQLGGFYPFMRAHSADNAKTFNEPYNFGPQTMKIATDAILLRYSVSRFMYTKMWEAHLWGGSVVQPLFFEFPSDPIVYTSTVLDETFMFGHSLLVLPVLAAGVNKLIAYLPNQDWYHLTKLTKVFSYDESGGKLVDFPCALTETYMNVLIKGGSIIPWQDATTAKAMTITDMNAVPTRIIVAPSHLGAAIGTMIADDGISQESNMDTQNRHYDFVYTKGLLKINLLNGFEYSPKFAYEKLDSIVILGWGTEVAFLCGFDSDMNKFPLSYKVEGGNLIMNPVRDGHNQYSQGRLRMNIERYLYGIESIVFGGEGDENICNSVLMMTEKKVSSDGKSLTGTLKASESENIEYDLSMSVLTDNIGNLKIVRKDGYQYQVKHVVEESFRTPHGYIGMDQFYMGTSEVEKEFFFEVSDPNGGYMLSTKNQPLIYTKNFLQLRTIIRGRRVYGIGERVDTFELPEGVYTMYSRDQASQGDNGKPPGHNVYGVHPFYMVQLEADNKYAGVFILNSNAMDFKFRRFGDLLEFDHLLAGGVIDMFVIKGGDPLSIVREYHNIIGKAAPVPYWAFGFHQCRWGYRNQRDLEDVVERFEELAIPLDAMWTDIDYMYKYRDFTLDLDRYPTMTDFIGDLHKKHKKFVPILDAGIGIGDYDTFNEGVEGNLFIKSKKTGKYLVGIVWPGYSAYPDFLHPNTSDWWQKGLNKLYQLLAFDGLWLDMNEASNFCDGECPDHLHWLLQQWPMPLGEFDNAIYIPGHRMLQTHLISTDALHYPEGEDPIPEYNLHSMFGFYETRETYNFFAKRNQRPFIISRSTFAGSGQFTSHWLGDNWSQWPFLRHSVAGIYNSQIFGIPFVGADICGFLGEMQLEMCERWVQLGAFYPFMRDHNNFTDPSQEFYVNEQLLNVYKISSKIRYSLIRYMYTLHMEVIEHGGMYFKPMLMDYPLDPLAYNGTEDTFLLGDIKVSPVMDADTEQFYSYFPNADWYEVGKGSGHRLVTYNKSATTGQMIQLQSKIGSGYINMHIRGGSIIPFQDPFGVQTTHDLLSREIGLYVAPTSDTEVAKGVIFYDDGQSLDVKTTGMYIEISMIYDAGSIRFHTSNPGSYIYNFADKLMEVIVVMNQSKYKDNHRACIWMKGAETFEVVKTTYGVQHEVMIIEFTSPHPAIDLTKIDSITWNDETCPKN